MFRVTVAALAVSLPLAAGAATFQITTDLPGLDPIGTFEAPESGGFVSDLSVEQMGGVVFDTRFDAGGPFSYDPVAVDFTDLTSISYTNSADFPGVCGPGDCLLTFFPLPDDPFEPGDLFAIDAFDNNIDTGTKYRIDPVPLVGDIPPIPLPAAGWMLLAGLGAMVLRRAGRR